MHNSANHMHALFASLWLRKTKESLNHVIAYLHQSEAKSVSACD